MPHYRVYHLDPHSGHINHAEDLDAADDVAALADARQRQCDYPLELWQGARKVSRVDALPELAARMS